MFRAWICVFSIVEQILLFTMHIALMGYLPIHSQKASAIEIYTYSCLTHSLASKLRRPVSWEVDILPSDPGLNIHLSLVGMS